MTFQKPKGKNRAHLASNSGRPATSHAESTRTAPSARYLIVDGHSIIFAWPELRKLHERRTALAREALAKQLRDYQDWTGVHVVLVFDGQGPKVSAHADPYDVQVFYSRKGQTADAVVERLSSKYAAKYEVTVATSDLLERQTVTSFGALAISPEMLRQILEEEPSRERLAPVKKSSRAH